MKPNIADWNEYQEYFDKQLQNISIGNDIDTSDIKRITSSLNRLYNEIFFDAQRYKTLLENIEDLCDQVAKRNQVGSNLEERKKNGLDALSSWVSPKDGKAYDLADLRRNYRERFNFTKAVIDSINFKRSSMITSSEILKVEASLVGGQG